MGKEHTHENGKAKRKQKNNIVHSTMPNTKYVTFMYIMFLTVNQCTCITVTEVF